MALCTISVVESCLNMLESGGIIGEIVVAAGLNI